METDAMDGASLIQRIGTHTGYTRDARARLTSIRGDCVRCVRLAKKIYVGR
jgi:hypothetical protein